MADLDTGAAAKSLLAGMAGIDTSSVYKSALAGIGTGAAAKSLLAGMAGIDTSSVYKSALAGIDTSAVARSLFAGLGVNAASKIALAGLTSALGNGIPLRFNDPVYYADTDSLASFVDKLVNGRRPSSVFSAEPATAEGDLASSLFTEFSICGLTREQARKAFGNYMYVATLVVIAELAIIAIMSGNLSSNILSLGNLITGLSGHAIARAARTLAQRAFDLRYPE